MNRTRLVIAGAIVIVMLALQWIGWIGSTAEPVILGIPIQFAYFIAYAALSAVAVWAIFRLVWPARHK
ncbi:hypothetical protein SAMN06265360_11776 [Haloechinothrix alba]|uniref:Uncharacterized protein n=1 Tax=Haloechinothrix alba TaxID=664784 RepID=A0A238YV44_9PSEU|nr:hypothetical protein [Haloechinothrix alba]SNR75146.1 hypothetical protein SAMN06265360_11776 [Haloechinothrix alba]